ncbi:hypothetical protein GCM10010166_61130 [Couchioplanes caeruleus subsp. azureus]|nr:hypothetical protein GCM10010166_61130 [Couchioplanes caeruleus subsp. azureus]
MEPATEVREDHGGGGEETAEASALPAGGRRRPRAGEFDQGCHGHDPFGAVGPERAAGVGHPVADAEPGDAGTGRLDHTGRLDAHSGGQLSGVEAAAEVDVGEVEPGGPVPDPDLARTRFADLDRFTCHDPGGPGPVEADGLGHACLLGNGAGRFP